MELIQVRVTDLVPHPGNYRSHPEEQVQRLQSSLHHHKQQKNVVLWRGGPDEFGTDLPPNTILAGHGLVDAAKARGDEFIWASYYTESDPTSYVAADNESVRGAKDDDLKLYELCAQAREAGKLDATGITEKELEALAPRAKHDDTDPVQEITLRCAPGEVWEIAGHRIACGDGRDADLLDHLFRGTQARLLWADPPYGVELDEKNKRLNKTDRGRRSEASIANDATDEGAVTQLVHDVLVLAAAFCMKGAGLYSCAPQGDLLEAHLRAIRTTNLWAVHQTLVWVKQHFVIGMSNYQYKHELITYGWKTDGPHYFRKVRNQDSVFEVDRPMVSKLHPSMKPLALVMPQIENSSQPGEIIYDPFAGSGTTLVAAAATGRIGYGVELKPEFASATILRLEKETHEMAVKV